MILFSFLNYIIHAYFLENNFSQDENLILPRSYVKKHTLIPFFVTAKDIFQKENTKSLTTNNNWNYTLVYTHVDMTYMGIQFS